MADVTLLAAPAGSTSNATSYAALSGAFNPTVGRLLVVLVTATGTVDAAPTLTESAGGGSYALVHTNLFSANANRQYLFIRNTITEATTSRSLTFACAADAATGAGCHVMEVSSPLVAGAAACLAKSSNRGQNSVPSTGAWDVAVTTTNPTILGLVSTSANPPPSTAPTNWTSLSTGGGFASPTTGQRSSKRASGFALTTSQNYATTDTGNWGTIGIEINVTPRALELDCQPGSFAITGADSGGGYGRFMSADPGAYAITGVAANTNRGYNLDAQPGAFIVTGSVAGALFNRILNAQPGSFAVTGIAMSAYRDYTMNALPGSYTVSGADIGNLVNRVLNAQPGSFAVTGVAAGLLADRMIIASPGSFLVTGAAAELTYTPNEALTHYTLSADPGSFGVSGSVIGGGYDRVMNAEPGSFAVVGSPATLRPPIIVIPAPLMAGPVRKFIEENIGDLMAVRVARVELVSNSSGSASRRIRVDGSWLLAVKIDHNGSDAGCDVAVTDADRTLLEITDSNTDGYYPVREEVVGADGVGLGLFEPSVLTGNLVATMAQAGANKSVFVTVFYQ